MLRADLPVREYDKLAPTSITNNCNSARSSISSAGSNAGTDYSTTVSGTSAPAKKCASTNTNQKKKVSRNNGDSADDQLTSHTESIEMTNINNKSNNKCPVHQPTSNNKGHAGKNISDKGTNPSCSNKATNSDDTLILRICDLEYTTRRSSVSSTTNGNGYKNGEVGPKAKARNETDSNSPKQKQQRRYSAAAANTNHHQKGGGSPRVGTSSHHSNSKCNCSSCNTGGTATETKTATIHHQKTKSVGTQHDATGFDPWVKQGEVGVGKSNQRHLSNSGSGNGNTKVIVITDDFKKKALNQNIRIDSKRNKYKYMKTNKSLGSSRSMDDICICNDDTEGNEGHDGSPKIVKTKTATSGTDDASADGDLIETVIGSSNSKSNTKTFSKSVDNISVQSTDNDALDNVGSVELIFISDEFLNEVNKQDVIVLKNNGCAKASVIKTANGNVVNDKQIIVVSDDFRRKSLQDQKIVVIDEPKKGKGKANPKLNRQSSAESSVDDVNNKITSRAFQSYDEEAENLESKEIKSPVLEETEILL